MKIIAKFTEVDIKNLIKGRIEVEGYNVSNSDIYWKVIDKNGDLVLNDDFILNDKDGDTIEFEVNIKYYG